MKSEARRPYRQTARAAAAENTSERILDAFFARLRDEWFDEIRLEDVARAADVSVQTVIRRFGSKEGLLDATRERMGRMVLSVRAVAPGDVDRAIEALIEDYETTGDLLIRTLAQEARYPALRAMTDVGRAGHRGWLAETFATRLDGLSAAEAQLRLDALVIATDVYVWKLVRRDMGRPTADLAELMRRLIVAALGGPTPLHA